MSHEDRRKETGKMLMDVTKYLLTVGIVGGILTERLSTITGVILFIIAIIVFLIGFYVIPPRKEE